MTSVFSYTEELALKGGIVREMVEVLEAIPGILVHIADVAREGQAGEIERLVMSADGFDKLAAEIDALLARIKGGKRNGNRDIA